MTSVDTSSFPEARKREHELNHRQREILDLLVAGKTNGEIAGHLGMTLDGAKWNVSEILTKLGLTTREEAAEYWRWRRGLRMRTGSLLRRLASVVPLKWAAGGAAAAAVGVVVVLAIGAARETRELGAAFYLTAHIRVTDRSATIGGMDGPGDEETSVLTWWQANRDEARITIERTGIAQNQSTTIVMDGEYNWIYLANSNTYSRTELPPLPDEIVNRGALFGLLVGPSPFKTRPELVAQLSEWADPNPLDYRGTATVLGLSCERIGFGPARTSSSGGTGDAELCLHEPSMVVLRYTSRDPVQDIHAELTALDLEPDLDDALFRFEPPEGAVLAEPGDTGSSASSSSPGSEVAPPPFLSPGNLSEDLRPTGEDREFDANSQLAAHTMRFESPGATLTISQTRDVHGIGARPPAAQTLEINGSEAWMLASTTASGATDVTVVTWRDGIRIVLRAEGLAVDEVVDIAAALERR